MSRVIGSLLFAAAVAGCKCQAPVTPVVAVTPKCVPKILVARQGTPTLDGELDEPVWHAAAATEPFVHATVDRVVPHTEARAAWDADSLYLVLYAADADLRSSDQVAVQLEGAGSIAVSPSGVVECHFGAQADCAAAGVVAKLDKDGDVDDDKEEDEEWAVELSVPWKLLAPGGRPSQVPIGFSRLETLNKELLKEVWTRGCGEIRVEP